jgi:signal transduction histidine kinase
MRRFASDILSGRGVSFEFDAPEVDESIELGANVRREIFAIFKESINNAVKYSECTKVATRFIVSNDSHTVRVSDDGKGFDTEFVLSEIFKPEMGGNGLASMKRRASELGGVCDIRSVIGEGTEINVTVPIGPRESG